MTGEFEVPGVELRFTTMEDGNHLAKWLSDPFTMMFFPMSSPQEAEDSAQRWISFCRYNCSLTAVKDGEVIGLSTLYLQPYRKLIHQSEMGIIVRRGFRSSGIGSLLLSSIMNLAKEKHGIELLHLQVTAHNPAIRLYKRFGFREFGRQTHWIKNQGAYTGRVFMERFL